MRILLRIILVAMLVVFSALILLWSLTRNSNAAQSAQAATATPTIPEHCVKDLQEWLAKPRSPQERQTAVQAELDCATGAQTYPSRKKTALAKFTPPTPRPPDVPFWTPTPQIGIQNGDFNPYSQDPFMAVDDGNNLWVGIVNGKVVSIFAGYLNNEQENQDWQTQPGWKAQGAVRVWVDDSNTFGVIYPTLTRNGDVHFIAACDAVVFLQAEDGTVFAFNAATLSYVSNTVMACPTVTVQPGIASSKPIMDPGNFMLADYRNIWQDTINGKPVQVYAGSLYEEDNPDHPHRILQGLVLVRVAGAKDELYPTPKRRGEVHFIAACGTRLFLKATSGAIFVFDVATLSYVNNAPACPTVTP
ncbi:MAG: hypothetical protein WA821_11590 [Anaerolineales bacterium]